MSNNHSNSMAYFDHAATTACYEEVGEAVSRVCCIDYGNPSSPHQLGKVASRTVSESRLFFANHFQTRPDHVVFTGSGTESDNLAILGCTRHLIAKKSSSGKWPKEFDSPPRVLISAIEHPAVRNAALSLEDFGIEVKRIPCTPTGQIQMNAFLDLISPNTVLVSIMRVNNIVGSLLPVEELARATKEKNPKTLFHCDAIQAFGKIDVPKASSAVDLVSISAHKVHGPKGIGALIVLNPDLLREKRLTSVILGGGQEFGLRSGTPSTPLIAAFHLAAKKTLENRKDFESITRELKESFQNELIARKLLGNAQKTTWNSPDDGVPYIVNLGFPGLPAQAMANLIEEQGCIVATGSACSSNKNSPDPVLSALGLPLDLQQSSIRISFDRNNTREEVTRLVQALESSFERLSKLKA